MRAHRGGVAEGLRCVEGIFGISSLRGTGLNSFGFFGGRSLSRQVQVHNEGATENAQPSASSLEPLRVFVVAGEPSGEAIAAGIMKELKDLWRGRVHFSGIGR